LALPETLITLALLVNLVAFTIMGYDKYAAHRNQWRIPEKRLMVTALVGGSPGILLGMKIFRHKIRHRMFAMGIPVITILQLLLLFWIYYN